MNQEHPRPRIRGPFLVAIVVVLTLLALAAGMPASPRTASAQTIPTRTSEATIVGGSGATVTPLRGVVTPTAQAGPPTPIVSGGGRCQLVITEDDGVAPGTGRIEELPIEGLPNRDPRYTYIRACEIIYTDANGQFIPNYTFTGPVEGCFVYTAEDVARAGGNPARLTIIYYDEATGTWVEVEVVIDEASGLICGKLPRSGKIALVIRGQVAGLPNTSGNLPDATPVAAAAAPAAAPGAAPAEGAQAAPAAPAEGAAAPAEGAQAAPAAAPAEGAQAAPALAAPAAIEAAAAPEAGSLGPILAMLLGVAAAVFAVILVLSRSMLSRSRDSDK